MSLLAERARILAEVLEGVENMPEPCQVDISSHKFAVGVKCQMTSYAHVVAWGDRLGCAVTFVDHKSHVHVSVGLRVNGHEVQLWTHMTASDAFHLLRGQGLDLGAEPVSVSAARLSTPDAQPVAG